MCKSHLVVAVAMCVAASLGAHKWSGWRYWREVKQTLKSPGKENWVKKHIHHLQTFFISGIIIINHNTPKHILSTKGKYIWLLKWLQKSLNSHYLDDRLFRYKSWVILSHFAHIFWILVACVAGVCSTRKVTVQVLNGPLLWRLPAWQHLLFWTWRCQADQKVWCTDSAPCGDGWSQSQCAHLVPGTLQRTCASTSVGPEQTWAPGWMHKTRADVTPQEIELWPQESKTPQKQELTLLIPSS